MIINRARARRTAAIEHLDPKTDWLEIYRRLTLWEMPAEARFGFQLAFYRPLAVPRMAEVLSETGHFRRNTIRRAYDTGIIVHEIIWGGVDSERGQQMVSLMNRLHDRPEIRPEDMRYVLDALTVVPIRFMDQWGWRRVSDAEREATWRFCDVLGEHMHITDRARSFGDAEVRLRTFESRELAQSRPGRELTASVLRALRDRLPAPARPLAEQITSCLVGDPTVSAALGLPQASAPTIALLSTGGRLRRVVDRIRRPADRPSFWPGRSAGSVYPDGYTLDQLGPHA